MLTLEQLTMLLLFFTVTSARRSSCMTTSRIHLFEGNDILNYSTRKTTTAVIIHHFNRYIYNLLIPKSQSGEHLPPIIFTSNLYAFPTFGIRYTVTTRRPSFKITQRRRIFHNSVYGHRGWNLDTGTHAICIQVKTTISILANFLLLFLIGARNLRITAIFFSFLSIQRVLISRMPRTN